MEPHFFSFAEAAGRLLIVFLLVLLNGFFVAAEFAIVKVRSTQIETLVKKHDRRARVADNVIQHLDAYLSATQLGITLASLGLGWLGEPFVAELLFSVLSRFGIQNPTLIHSFSLGLAFSFITFLHIIVGELAPKSIAIQRSQSTALWIAVPLTLFYKVGPSPSRWWGMVRTSSDEGQTWSEARRLPEGMLGPIKNKPIEVAQGKILCPSSTEGKEGWRLEMEWTRDLGKTWQKTQPLNDGKTFGAIQPSILKLGNGELGLVCRSKQGKVLFAKSRDAGRTWSPLAALDVPNPNSGIDALTLADGRHLLVYNDTPRGRTPLNVAVSKDGMVWRNVLTLESEPGEYSYPAVIQTADGRVHVTYTWRRERVRHVVIDASKLPTP